MPEPYPSAEPPEEGAPRAGEPDAATLTTEPGDAARRFGVAAGAGGPDDDPPAPRGETGKGVRRLGDVLFAGTALGSGILILLVLAGVAVFLLVEALPALRADPGQLPGGEGFWSFIWPLLAGTIIASVIAMVLATPVAVGIALFISHYAHKRVASPIGFVIDLLAAVPSVVFGMWGMQVLAPAMVPAYEWLAVHLGWIPLFSSASATGRTILTAAIVLAVMILPIITSVSREVFLQTPKLHEEASLALGATRWEMIRMTVLPFGRPGVIGGVMVGLGRALGETMAVAIILSTGGFTWVLTDSGNNTVPSFIALNFPEASGITLNALVAAGLVLFVITLAVNLMARYIVDRRKDFSGAN